MAEIEEPKKKKIISQKDYLKRYLSSGQKKKEKKKCLKRVNIIDDNFDNTENDCTFGINSISEFDKNDEFAPQIVGVVDERPKDIKILDTYKNKRRWKPIGEDNEIEDPVIDSAKINNYVQQINKSTLNDLISDKNDLPLNGVPIKRNRKTGEKISLKNEKMKEKKKQEILEKHKEKYAIWGKGIKQVNDALEKYESDLHEMQKPLARYKDDQDLENLLKSKIRDGDPMLEYITKNNETSDYIPEPVQNKFRGFCPPNRFGIIPGHKWDGVDRSNGYEAKFILQQNTQKTVEDEAYKWSCSDM